MKMLDRLLNATRLAGRSTLTANRTAADDLRDLGFPTGAAGGRTGEEKEDTDEEDVTSKKTTDDDLAEDLEEEDEELDPQKKKQAARGETDDEDVESFGETDESDPNYKKRFVGSQKQHLEDKRQLEAMQARLDRLEQQRLNPPAAGEPTAIRDETAARLQAELDQIPADDKDTRRKTIEKWVGTARNISREEGEAAARRVIGEVETNKKGFEEAKVKMIEALERKGLPASYFEKADEKALILKNKDLVPDPNRPGKLIGRWFLHVPIDKQFDALADLVAADRAAILKEATKEANVQLRKGAEGIVGKGNQTKKPKSTDKDDVPDRSFTQQLKDNRKLRQNEGARRYAEAGH